MEHNERIYWSDLSYEKQEEIKEGLEQNFRDDKELMAELKTMAEDEIKDDEEENTERNLKWHIDTLIEKKVDEVIGTFYGQITMEY